MRTSVMVVYENHEESISWSTTLPDRVDALKVTNDKLAAEYRGPQDLTVLTWSGDLIIVGDANGRVMAFRP